MNKDERFTDIKEVIPDVIYDIRYYSDNNFTGQRIDGYLKPLALLSKEALISLKEAAAELREKGYKFIIYDAYRPEKAVVHFVRWAKDPDDIRMKEYFYPELDKSVLFEKGFIAERSAHSRGSTVDLTLYDIENECEVDMGGTFDYFGERSHTDYEGISDMQHENRMLLKDVMERHGFVPIREEWWHFTLKDEPYPDTYFDFDVE